jgi:hypothetical protein
MARGCSATERLRSQARSVIGGGNGVPVPRGSIDRTRRINISPYAGSIRRECLDHIVVFGERHLRHVLLAYMNYYNGTRTHLSLNKDAPMSRRGSGTLSVPSYPGRTASPICSGLSFRYTQRVLRTLFGCQLRKPMGEFHGGPHGCPFEGL